MKKIPICRLLISNGFELKAVITAFFLACSSMKTRGARRKAPILAILNLEDTTYA
ncbi:hypothetical protein IKE99_01110 [Candidatus Saccharibacteria bacterium]|nr:hypothetical protein [Candidatus Saccharibacteria bacterium]